MKALLKFILLIICLTFTFILLSAVFPYSETFNDINDINPKDIVFLSIVSFWICLVILYISKKSHSSEKHTAFGLSLSLFFIYGLMTQIDNIFLDNVWVNLKKADILFQVLGNGISVVLVAILGMKLFGIGYRPSRYSRKPKRYTALELILKLILVGISYVIIYFTFNYFIGWEIEDFRIVYTGNSEMTDFIAHLVDNWNNKPQVYLFQFIKGALLGLFILPIVYLFRNRSLQMQTSIFLVFETTALFHIIPNYLIPNGVRMGAFLEVSCLMLLFSIIIWFIFEKIKFSKQGHYRGDA